jgi:hypothetical protein
MPVIRGQAKVNVLPAERRAELEERLRQELAGGGGPGGPVIFEIPLDRSSKRDVVVVWDAFESVASEDRSSMITEAYADEQATISLALGVTYEEALEQQVLPYAVVPKAQTGDVDPDELRRAMLGQGGFISRQGRVDLRFPTMAMAEQACGHLSDKLHGVYWSIVQSPLQVS